MSPCGGLSNVRKGKRLPTETEAEGGAYTDGNPTADNGRKRVIGRRYSLNAPVPGEAKRLAADLLPRLTAFERVREDHTLLVKRFGGGERGTGRRRKGGADHRLATLRKRVRPVLEDVPPFKARITGIDCFERPTRGSDPVLYFAVESPGVRRVHRRLVEEFGAVADLEGKDYTPHVTLARDGSLETARELVGEMGAIEPIEWTVSELRFYDPRYRETVGRVPLPA